MKFTDEDLKRVKGILRLSKDCEMDYGDEFRVVDIESLIARLEAAEKYISVSVCDQDTTAEMWEAWKSWLASKGAGAG